MKLQDTRDQAEKLENKFTRIAWQEIAHLKITTVSISFPLSMNMKLVTRNTKVKENTKVKVIMIMIMTMMDPHHVKKMLSKKTLKVMYLHNRTDKERNSEVKENTKGKKVEIVNHVTAHVQLKLLESSSTHTVN